MHSNARKVTDISVKSRKGGIKYFLLNFFYVEVCWVSNNSYGYSLASKINILLIFPLGGGRMCCCWRKVNLLQEILLMFTT